MAVSNKLRFEVFRRDNFACRYCGRSASEGAVLEADHVDPRSRGGQDAASNLVTACEACNSGKSDRILAAPPVNDVPQDLFRQACAARGVEGVELTCHHDREASIDVVGEILGRVRPEEEGPLFEAARESLIRFDQLEPTSSRIRARAAADKHEQEYWELHGMNSALERLITQVVPIDGIRGLFDEAAADYKERGFDPESASKQQLLIVATDWYCQGEDERLLAALPPEEVEEWLAYADALNGNPPFGLNESERNRWAAEAVRWIRAGRFYPHMCHATAGHIGHCPRWGGEIIWIEECRHCDAGSPTSDAGHLVCVDHLEQIRRGAYIGIHTGEPITLSRHAPLHAIEREDA